MTRAELTHTASCWFFAGLLTSATCVAVSNRLWPSAAGFFALTAYAVKAGVYGIRRAMRDAPVAVDTPTTAEDHTA